MFRLYRELERGEFVLVGVDCSQGGADSNFGSFLSANKLDFPISYEQQGVAANATEDLFPILEWIFDITGIKPVVAFERNNGGASEMERLSKLNRNNKFEIFIMPKIGTTDDNQETRLMGWNTSSSTRPILVGDWKDAIDCKVIKLYDAEVVKQHKAFIVSKTGKPQASGKSHDDAVISPAIAWQLYQRVPIRKIEQPFHQVPYQASDDVIGI